jgi:outer membrane lipoprotein-sorting protein
MKNARKLAAVALLLMPVGLVRPVLAADDLGKVMARLDEESAKFKSASADLTWDNVQVHPFPDPDTQVGTILFDREAGKVQVAVHLKSENGKAIHKDIVYAGGKGKLYDAMQKQMNVFAVGDKQAQFDSLLTLGFGGSGKDLQKDWTVTYVGAEQVNGAAAAKLQLVPRDPNLAKTAPKVLLWVDMDKGVAVKQQRFDASDNYVTFTYANVKLNVPVSSNSFDIKTPSGTQIVNH